MPEAIPGTGIIPPTLPQPGTVVDSAGRYELRQPLSQDALTTRWIASDRVLSRSVLLRLLRPDLEAIPAARGAFLAATATAAGVSHPNLVRALDAGSGSHGTFVISELAEGEPLRSLVARLEPLEPAACAHIAMCVARAAQVAQASGLRLLPDIDNVLLVAQGGVKLDNLDSESVRRAAGLPTQDLTPVQAIGRLLFELLAGKRPDESGMKKAGSLRLLRPGISRELDACVSRALAAPAHGFSDLGALAAALARLNVESAPLPAPKQPPAAGRPRQPGFFRSEGRWLAPAIGLFVLAAGVVIAGFSIGHVPGTSISLPSLLGGEKADGRLTIAGAGDFDPLGDGKEHPEDLAKSYDGNAASGWRTETYHTADLGGAKAGVGMWVDLGQEGEVDRAHVLLARGGGAVELRASSTLAPRPEDWKTVAGADPAGKDTTLRPAGVVRTRFLLLWFTRLPGGGTDFSESVLEIQIYAPKDGR
ncbi:MAG: hypothetical protein WDA71_03455 [Actinomycetota bacterium]